MDFYEAEKELYHKGHGGMLHSRKVARNTWLERQRMHMITLRLYKTDIITWYDNNTAMLWAGGWQTALTKERINSFLSGWLLFTARHHPRADKHWWLVPLPRRENQTWVPFLDGITVHLRSGQVITPQRDIEQGLANREPGPTKREKVNAYMTFILDPDSMARLGRDWEVSETPVGKHYGQDALSQLASGHEWRVAQGAHALVQAKYLSIGALSIALRLDAAVRGELHRSPEQEAMQWAEILASGKEPPRFRSTVRRMLSYYMED